MWRNVNTNEVSETQPVRVRLTDRTTRTNADITEDHLEESGWVYEPDVIVIPEIPSVTGP